MFDWLTKRLQSTRSGVDARLLRLQSEGIICSTCGNRHYGLFDLGFDRPAAWKNEWPVTSDTNPPDSNQFLMDDFCAINGEDFFVRCLLRLPIVDLENQDFGFGVWSSLSKENFKNYAKTFHEDPGPDQACWFGWFSNSLKGYPETLALKCDVHLQPNNQRPLIWLQESDHPLSREQRNGISIDRVFDLYKLNGHELS